MRVMFSTRKTSISSSHERFSYHLSCNGNDDCNKFSEYCDIDKKLCVCERFYEHVNDGGCSPCPSEGNLCVDCCSNTNLSCEDNICVRCDNSYAKCDASGAILMNASQIALIAALLMGAAALATLLYRICTRASFFGSRRIRLSRSREENEPEFQRASRASLSSIQVRVISRLRDRPPKYETQHNYDTRIQREEEEIQRTNADTNTSIDLTQTVSVIDHAPPAYDGCRESVHESPPPYSDTSHDILPEVVVMARVMSNRVEESNDSNENSTISIISNTCSLKDAFSANKSESDNKDNNSIHM